MKRTLHSVAAFQTAVVLVRTCCNDTLALSYTAASSKPRRSFNSPTALGASPMEVWIDARSTTSPLPAPDALRADAVLASSDGPSPSEDIRCFVQKGNNLLEGGGGEKIIGTLVDITDGDGQDAALAAVGSSEWVHVTCERADDADGGKDAGWTMIPAENLIAASRGTGTWIAVAVDRVEDVVGLSRALELGVDALSVSRDAPAELWDAVFAARAERNASRSAAEMSFKSLKRTMQVQRKMKKQRGGSSLENERDEEKDEKEGSEAEAAGDSDNMESVADADTSPDRPRNVFGLWGRVKRKREKKHSGSSLENGKDEEKDEKEGSEAEVADDSDSMESVVDIDTSSDQPRIVLGLCRRLQTLGSNAVMADRVCVDLVKSLSPTEGCFVGSSAKIMALVLSEAEPSSFVPTRPFRVNLGPVHSYVLLADGVTTKYLSELEPGGDEVLVYNAATGEMRGVAVGRLKVEVRPCVMIGLEARCTTESEEEGGDDNNRMRTGQVFLQQAETVRLAKLGDNFVRVTDLSCAKDDTLDGGGREQTSDEVMLRIVDTGTHVGKAYAGEVLEI